MIWNVPLGEVTLILNESVRFKIKFYHLTGKLLRIFQKLSRMTELWSYLNREKGHEIQQSKINHSKRIGSAFQKVGTG